ncbi:DUF222 domain-containing protein [Nocardioides piscis]|uniref:DUF222 domain-containing protein n=1 Tax=Nocardioides piscis TaxID=2714938 RepID=A0A6G7YH67_9ACTN|nr:DUF222 domain-containing protein [Nocardioides piscis]QIK76143.1 DUF222 domain-containing protein [Nocardioides piscis]
MFDGQLTQIQGPPPGGSGGVLAASKIREWKDALAAALEDAGRLDDDAKVEAIRALEEAVCVTTAAQAWLARELDASQRSQQAAAGLPAAKQGHGVAQQVALARRESPDRGKRHLGLAKIAATELPHTWDAWRAGRITEWKATIVARETACLTIEDRLEVDRLVASDPAAIEAMGDGEVAGACLREAARLDAASVTARRRRAESERRVTLRPAPDTMTYLTALLPVKDGVAVHAILSQAAAAARASGDNRTRGQVMADALVAAVLGRRTAQPTQSEPAQSEPTHGPRVSLGLVMTDGTLFGTADGPAHIDGFGPIPAELAREIVADACDRDEEVWLRRLYTSPATGELLSMDARGRRFRGGLARFIRLRDQVCRTPWCDAPIRHTDHARRNADGGHTDDSNGQGLCEACNYAKDAPGWRARPGPEGTIETTSPTGHTHTTRPPPIATIMSRQLPALTIDYVLAS